ncbi:MAG: phosphatase PAP2 family protein [Lachnospiraceae bacterium]|nr:phosphatase PAP2 family protein [Lachnospiraceae bacterium]
MIETLLTLDGNILLWIQDNMRAAWLTPVMITITKLGGLGFIWILLSLILLCFKKTRWAGVAGIVGLLFSLFLNNWLLKNAFHRIRPYEVIDGLVLLTNKATDFSFPSGHSGSSFAAAVAIVRSLKGSRARWLALAFAFLMAFTRLYIGIHYPTDVLCGALTGTLCGLAAAWLVDRFRVSILQK